MPSTIQDDIASLTEGKTIAVAIKEDLNYDQVYTKEDNFWTLLYLTGYLTSSSDSANCVVSPGPGRTTLAIPNREVKDVFKSEINSWFSQMLPKDKQEDFFKLFWKGDAQNLEKSLERCSSQVPVSRTTSTGSTSITLCCLAFSCSCIQ